MPRTTHTSRNTSRNSPYTARESSSLTSSSPYTPIDSENGDIRLIELAPGKFDDMIEMRLILHNISADVQSQTYEALSYVWGTKIASQKALLNRMSITITSNLDCALRHLRFTILKRTLWIDAVAMNQKDTQERNHQVQIMGSIYSNAQRVVVWLGPTDPRDLYTRAILGAMQFHFDGGDHVTITLFDYMCSVISLLNEQADVPKDSKECVLQALFGIVDRPWFNRVWVVQELALSKTATVRIGTFSFPWQPFRNYMNWLPQNKVDAKTHPSLAEAVMRVVRAPCDEHFSSQLCRTVHLSATDPRDKVFSLLGISGFSSRSIQPDYTKSVQRVFQEAIAALIRDAKLGIYFYAPLHPLREGYDVESLPHLPSWVPDLRITGAAYAKHMPRSGVYSHTTPHTDRVYHLPMNIVCGATKLNAPAEDFLNGMCQQLPFPPSRISTDLTTLFAPGVLIGAIIQTSSDLLHQLGELNPHSRLPQNIHRVYNLFCKTVDLDATRFIRVLLNPRYDVDGLDIIRSRAAIELLNPNLYRTNVSIGLRREMDTLCSEIVSNVGTRTLLLMGNGRVGVSYHPDPINGIRPGDLVVGLFGVNFPFLLRPHENNSFQMINVAGFVRHGWGHEFMGNGENGEWFYSSDNIRDRSHGWRDGPRQFKSNVSWKDYEQYGIREYAIV